MQQVNRISIGKAGSITLGVQLAIFAFSLISSVILARGLGPDARGSFALMLLITMVFIRLGSFGLEIANVYYTANQRHPIRDLVANSIIVGLVSGFVGIVVLYSMTHIPLIHEYFIKNNIFPPMLYALVATLPITLISTFLTGVLQGQERVFQFNAVNLIITFVLVVFQSILIFGLGFGLWGAVAAYGISAISGVSLAILYIRNITPISLQPSLTVFKDSTSYASKAYIANLLQFLNYRLDQFMVGFFLGPAALGFYVVAVGLVERLWMIPQSIAAVLFPRTSASGNEKADILTPKISRFTLLLLLMLSVGLGTISRPLILVLYGESFEPSIKPLLWLLPGIVALGYGKILMSDLAGRGRPDVGLVASAISFIGTLALDLLLIPRLGLVGAAVASSVTYILTTAVIVFYFRRISNVMISQLFFPQRSDILFYSLIISRTLTTLGVKK
jgi:O-antigen/teichoic acid export membrane protein